MQQDQLEYHSRLRALLENDPFRMNALELVQDVTKGEGWIGGGFVRHMVWDHLKGEKLLLNDIDVIYMGDGSGIYESAWTKTLSGMHSQTKWSVKDQNRMALLYSDKSSFDSIENAISHWVEKCTAVAVRLTGKIEILAPYGLHELFEGIISPTSDSMKEVMLERVNERKWLEYYPFLKIKD